jgi:molecular chaperone HscB
MEQETRGLPIQQCRHCGQSAKAEQHFCPKCDKILTLGRHGDYFVFFGLPRRLNLDREDLESRYRALSRQFHPDYFFNRAAAERLASLERSSYLNDAYRALRQLATRVEYLLRLEGMGVTDPSKEAGQLPPALLEEVFELNEELEDIRSLRQAGAEPRGLSRRLDGVRQRVEARRADHERDLVAQAARWDDQAERGVSGEERRRALQKLKERVLERHYITNLQSVIARELDLLAARPEA